MKKIILTIPVIALIVLGFVYYQKNGPEHTEPCDEARLKESKSKFTDCNVILRDIQGTTCAQRLEWMRNSIPTTSIDVDFCKCVAVRHQICDEVFYEAVKKDWDGKTLLEQIWQKKYTKIEVSEIKKFMFCNCYAAFIQFETDGGNNEISLKLGQDFNQTCYSFPLLKGVIALHGLNDDDEIEFVHTKFESVQGCDSAFEEGVYFRVKDKQGDYWFYNISDDPGHGMF